MSKEDKMLEELKRIRELLEPKPAPPPPKGLWNEFMDFISKYKVMGLAAWAPDDVAPHGELDAVVPSVDGDSFELNLDYFAFLRVGERGFVLAFVDTVDRVVDGLFGCGDGDDGLSKEDPQVVDGEGIERVGDSHPHAVV